MSKRHAAAGGDDRTEASGAFRAPRLDRDPLVEPQRPRPLRYPRSGQTFEAGATYCLEQRLGGGAFGSVFLARRLSEPTPDGPPEQVAIKAFHSPMGGDPVRSLKRELSSLLAIRTDRIPKVYDWSLEGDFAFVVMDYFPEASLDEVIDRGPLDSKQVWHLLGDLLTALQAAHQASILHLDIKPSNVLIDGKGGYVLTDFGISQASRVRDTNLAGGLGTPSYRAPEQRVGTPEMLDIRTDLWGIGSTTWAAYTGRDLSLHPELVQAASNNTPYGLPAISTCRQDCDSALEEVIMGLLHVDPSKRPGSAAEVLECLQELVRDQHLDAADVAALHQLKIDAEEVEALLDGLIDPLLVSILRRDGLERRFVKLEDGSLLSSEGENSYYTYLLLQGRVKIQQGGRTIHVESREGTFLGEVATLTGHPRTACMVADGEVWTCLFNAAELEAFVTHHPDIGLRLIRSMAERLARSNMPAKNVTKKSASGM